MYECSLFLIEVARLVVFIVVFIFSLITASNAIVSSTGLFSPANICKFFDVELFESACCWLGELVFILGMDG